MSAALEVRFDAIARAVAGKLRRDNSIVPCGIIEQLPDLNGTRTVQLWVGGAARWAWYPAGLLAPRVGYGVFACRMAPGTTADWLVVATNYQVGPVSIGLDTDLNWGTGTRPWGTGAGTWGS